MNNPLFNLLGGAPMQNQAGNILQRLQQFRQNIRGDPRQQVEQLLRSGKVSQQQYDQAVQMARQLQQMLGGR